MPYPEHVELCEVGPRDGFQYEERVIPTERKLQAVERLAAAGLRRLQVASFVHPQWVTQMADAEELVARLPRREGVTYAGLALNLRGVERALAAGLEHVDLSIATNERHSRDNANMSVEAAAQEAEAMIDRARAPDAEAQLGFQTVFGYAAPGDTPLGQVVELARHFAARGIASLSLADTTGMANPVMIRERVEAVQEAVGEVPLVLHLHDTRGLGLANVVAALACGVARFDTALGGMGGCPFIPGAAGNIATEDTAYLLDTLGIRTGIDRAQVADCSLEMEAFLEKKFPGKLHRLREMGDRETGRRGDGATE